MQLAARTDGGKTHFTAPIVGTLTDWTVMKGPLPGRFT